MKAITDIEWFKSNFAQFFKGYDVNYRFYEEGDFGSLNQIDFNSNEKGGNIDVWGKGWLGIFLWDYKKEEQIMNVLLSPEQENEKQLALERFKNLL
jgi:hypothetical protein